MASELLLHGAQTRRDMGRRRRGTSKSRLVELQQPQLGGSNGGGDRDGPQDRFCESFRRTLDAEEPGKIRRSSKWVTRHGPECCLETHRTWKTDLLAVEDPPVCDSTLLLDSPRAAADVLSKSMRKLVLAAGDQKAYRSRGSTDRNGPNDEAAVRGMNRVPKVSGDRVSGRAVEEVVGGHPAGAAAAGWVQGPGFPVQMHPQFDLMDITGKLQTFRGVEAFEVMGKIGQGTYGVVFRAMDRETGEVVALKKMDADKKGRIPKTALREIGILASLRHHPSVVRIKEVVSGARGGIYMVMECAEHDLRTVVQGMRRPLKESEVKFLMLQLLLGILFIHHNGVLHRDLKTSNLLFNRRGGLQICDFGLSRRCINGGRFRTAQRVGTRWYVAPDVQGAQEQHPYTGWVGTRWYKAPELLLKAGAYSAAVDMWSAGCIMAELLRKGPLFKGENHFDQLHQIFGVLGTPNEGSWPGYTELCRRMEVGFVWQPCNRLRYWIPPTCLSEAGYDFLMSLFRFDPTRRMTASEALNHEWFTEDPAPSKLQFET